jgi:hypothetical protein
MCIYMYDAHSCSFNNVFTYGYFCFASFWVWLGLMQFVELGSFCVAQAGLVLMDPPASASPVLELQVCTTMPSSIFIFKKMTNDF